jgi:hypothetical protein
MSRPISSVGEESPMKCKYCGSSDIPADLVCVRMCEGCVTSGEDVRYEERQLSKPWWRRIRWTVGLRWREYRSHREFKRWLESERARGREIRR